MPNLRPILHLMNSKQTMTRGFTLIELLVVIAIIGLLSSVVLASLNEARINAQAVRTVRELNEMQKALAYLGDHENITRWWNETAFGFGTNPTMAELASQSTRLGMFLPKAPVPVYGTEYIFDSDNDTYTSCNAGTINNGVGISAQNAVLSIQGNFLIKVDEIIDNGDGANCGRFVWNTTSFVYKLGRNWNDYPF